MENFDFILDNILSYSLLHLFLDLLFARFIIEPFLVEMLAAKNS
jgi:hypothetical protein